MQYSQIKKLNEADNTSNIHIYVDEESGDQYIFTNGELIKIKTGGGGKGHEGDGPQIGDKPETAEEEAEMADEREKLKGEIDDVETDDERQERVNRIKDMFNDEKTAQDVTDEAEKAIQKERQVKADRAAKKYNADPLTQFRLSLEGFIRKQISVEKEKTWKRMNKTYAHSNIIKKGRAKLENGHIPKINVYFDQSGSWGLNDVKLGEQAIASLNKYEQKREITIDVYYFNTRIHSTPPGGGGTDVGAVINHIIETKPDNVIVMTDSDGGRFGPVAVVPGAVWFLWKNGDICYPLIDHLKGAQLTKSFELRRTQ